MPEKVSLSRQIIKSFAFLSLFTFLASLSLLILSRVSLNSDGALRQLAGAGFLEKRGLALAIISFVFGLAGLKTASGIKKGRPWSWPASLIIAVLLVCLFPLGTIFGLKLLFDLFRPEVKDWFWHHKKFLAGPEGQVPEIRGLNVDLIKQLEEGLKKGRD